MSNLLQVRVLARPDHVMLLGLGTEGEPLLKARLPVCSLHPKAAVTALEGLALWSGRRLPVVLGVNDRSRGCVEALLPDGQAWTSPLLDLVVVDHPRPRRRIRLDGVGDFREAHQLRLPWEAP
jgi:hypothetical protein